MKNWLKEYWLPSLAFMALAAFVGLDCYACYLEFNPECQVE